MANTVKLKQSAVAGKVPTTADLALGELAINTTDGKLFLKKNVAGTESIVDVIGQAAAGAGGFASGTRLLFQQTSAPIGWTKDSTINDKALRVVSGSVASGGSVAFSTAFASQAVSGTISSTTATNQAATAGGTVGDTTLSTAQIPSHDHINQYAQMPNGGTPAWGVVYTPSGGDFLPSGPLGGNGSHTHGFTGASHNHTQNAHTHTFTGTAINLAVAYVDVIIATKD